MAETDLNYQLLLDIQHFSRQINRAVRQYTASMGQITKQTRQFESVSTNAAKNVGASWWKRFGAVALGFTIAYRAMNQFENGLLRIIELIRESIVLGGELASVQAKLAFWYTLHAKNAVEFGDAYKRAEVNTLALMKANLGAISTFEELATGIDEVAQTIGGVGPEWTKHLASVVDFTKLVAQTTGSTTRQIRQELQALMQGQIKTTDVMVRSLVRVGILSKQDIADLKNMTRQTEIFFHILEEIHSRWQDVADLIISTNVEVAMQKWEDHLKFMLIMGSKIASEYAGVGNLFAQVFVDHMKRIREELTDKDWTNIVLFLLNLQKALDVLLTAFEKTLKVIIAVVAGFSKLSETAAKVGTYVKYSALLLLIYKTFSLLVKLVGKVASKMVAFAVATKTAAVAVFRLEKTTKIMISRFFALALGISAVGVAITALYDYITDRKNKQAQKDLYDELMKGIIKLREAGEISRHEMLEWHHAIRESVKKDVPVKSFFDHFKDNVSKGVTAIGQFFAEQMHNFWNLFVKEPDLDEAKLAEVVNKFKKLLESELKGLTAIADPTQKVFDPKAVAKYEKAITKLRDQISEYGLTLSAIEADVIWWKDSDAISAYQERLAYANETLRRHAELIIEVGRKKADAWAEARREAFDVKLRMTEFLRFMQMIDELDEEISAATKTVYEHEKFLLDKTLENMRRSIDAMLTLTDKEKRAALTRIEKYAALSSKILEREFTKITEMSQRTAEIMESAFSDLFFDVISGDFRDLADLAERTFRSIQRMLADILAYFIRMKIFGEMIGGVLTGGIIKMPGATATAPVGGSEVNIQVNNNTAAEVGIEEQQNMTGGRDIVITVGELVSEDIKRGGPLHKTLRKTFGLNPLLTGR